MESKNAVLAILGAIGSSIAYILGGWDTALQTLLLFMGVDIVTGYLVGGVFHKSEKTEGGRLESRAGFKGLCRKGVILLIVLVAAQLDALMQTDIVRNAVIIAFIANELLSIIENAGLMGVKIPTALQNAIEVLQKNGDDSNENSTISRS